VPGNHTVKVELLDLVEGLEPLRQIGVAHVGEDLVGHQVPGEEDLLLGQQDHQVPGRGTGGHDQEADFPHLVLRPAGVQGHGLLEGHGGGDQFGILRAGYAQPLAKQLAFGLGFLEKRGAGVGRGDDLGAHEGLIAERVVGMVAGEHQIRHVLVPGDLAGGLGQSGAGRGAGLTVDQHRTEWRPDYPRVGCRRVVRGHPDALAEGGGLERAARGGDDRQGNHKRRQPRPERSEMHPH